MQDTSGASVQETASSGSIRDGLPEGFVILPRFSQHEPARAWSYRVILHNIVHLMLPPGSCVVESEVRQLLDVSRTPVREALMQLAQEDFVQIIPQKGTYVTLINLEQVLELRFIRRCVEIEVVKAACERMNPDVDQSLAEALAEQKRIAPLRDYEAFIRADDDMHRIIYASAGKLGVWEFFSRSNLHHFRTRLLGLRVEGVPNRLVEEHARLIEALATRDPGRAEAEAKRHLAEHAWYAHSVARTYPDYVLQKT